MMMRSLFALAAGLSAWGGCEREREAPLPGPPPFCIPAVTTNAGDAGRGPFVEHLKPSDLDGIFPPRWKKGDEWQITHLVRSFPVTNNEGRLWPVFAFFRVASVPSHESDVYRIEVRETRDAKPSYVFTVRGQDFSVATIDAGDVHITRGAHPFPNESRRADKFPIFLPSVAPERINPLFFEPEPDSAGEAKEGWQSVYIVDANTVHFELVSRDRWQYDTFRVNIEWRRGEPWWSSAKCWLATDQGSSTQPLTEFPKCDAKLVRDWAPPPPK
jgi:hypothetical protein